MSIDFDSGHGFKSWETSLALATKLYWYSVSTKSVLYFGGMMMPVLYFSGMMMPVLYLGGMRGNVDRRYCSSSKLLISGKLSTLLFHIFSNFKICDRFVEVF